MNYRLFAVFALVVGSIAFSAPSRVFSENGPEDPTLVQAAICETIQELTPQNRGIAFSVAIGKVICFTSFDPVPKEAVIYNNWFHRDRPSTKIRLTLKPPRWATFSSIKLRQADKGPWRVEITDQDGKVLQILRFSITD
jgi:hypothetical protein